MSLGNVYMLPAVNVPTDDQGNVLPTVSNDNVSSAECNASFETVNAYDSDMSLPVFVTDGVNTPPDASVIRIDAVTFDSNALSKPVVKLKLDPNVIT